MKRKLNALSRHYATALRKHLKQSSHADLQAALRLGRKAVVLGLETLKLAHIHERALAAIDLTSAKNGSRQRADVFFSKANTPIEENHRAARQTQLRLRRLKATLGQRTEQLAATHHQLRQGVARHKLMEEAFTKSGLHQNHCLEESLQLQKRLRQLTHKVMAAQEDERQKISHELQDEIAQTLLGINIRLLSLKQQTRKNTKGLKHEIATTQRLVVKSARSVRRFARELETHQEPLSARLARPL